MKSKNIFYISALMFLNSTAWSQSSSEDFNEVCYLAQNRDVLINWVMPGGKALDHYTKYGKSEGRSPNCKSVVRLNSEIISQVKNATISSRSVNGSKIELSSFMTSMAGAIGSIRWNGLEFINSYDHGRELQTAISFDGHGECYNPTEAGSDKDGSGSTSSSVLKLVDYSPSQLKTSSQMAFFMYGTRTGGGCKEGPQVNTPLSNHFLHKTVTMNYLNDPSVISYEVTLQNPPGIPKEYGVYELLTGYMTNDFQRAFAFDAKTGRVIEETQFISLVEQGFPQESYKLKRANGTAPLIVSTKNGSHALAAYFPKQRFAGTFSESDIYKFGGSGGPKGFASTKWNLVVREHSQNQQQRTFKAILIIGDLETVKAKLINIAKTM